MDALNEKGFNIVAPEKILSDPVVNPYLVGSYSTTGYMQSISGLPDPRRENLHVLTDIEKQKIHGYLTEQGLSDLIPAN